MEFSLLFIFFSLFLLNNKNNKLHCWSILIYENKYVCVFESHDEVISCPLFDFFPCFVCISKLKWVIDYFEWSFRCWSEKYVALIICYHIDIIRNWCGNHPSVAMIMLNYVFIRIERTSGTSSLTQSTRSGCHYHYLQTNRLNSWNRIIFRINNWMAFRTVGLSDVICSLRHVCNILMKNKNASNVSADIDSAEFLLLWPPLPPPPLQVLPPSPPPPSVEYKWWWYVAWPYLPFLFIAKYI